MNSPVVRTTTTSSAVGASGFSILKFVRAICTTSRHQISWLKTMKSFCTEDVQTVMSNKFSRYQIDAAFPQRLVFHRLSFKAYRWSVEQTAKIHQWMRRQMDGFCKLYVELR